MRVIVLLVVILTIVIAAEAVDGDAERIALWPIKVWKHLTPEHSCVIQPGQTYTTGAPMYPDAEKHPDSHGWYNVRSATCSGVALVGSVR